MSSIVDNKSTGTKRIILKLVKVASVAVGVLVAGNAVIAETVRVPVGQGSEAWSGKVPSRGITKAQVEAKFGAPSSKAGPNGEPPIYYWEYPDFTVYFEAEHVIHTVIKNR